MKQLLNKRLHTLELEVASIVTEESEGAFSVYKTTEQYNYTNEYNKLWYRSNVGIYNWLHNFCNALGIYPTSLNKISQGPLHGSTEQMSSL